MIKKHGLIHLQEILLCPLIYSNRFIPSMWHHNVVSHNLLKNFKHKHKG